MTSISHRLIVATSVALFITTAPVHAQLSGLFDLANADVTFEGIDPNDHSGRIVDSVGDVNGDGLDDLMIGAFHANADTGEAYLYYGRTGAQTLSGTLDLANADVVFNGISTGDLAGRWTTTAGDINGDGFDDILVTANHADSWRGHGYLIYGRGGVQTLTGAFDLTNADVMFEGIAEFDIGGFAASSVGDFNGDNLDDFVITANLSDATATHAGETYLFYGRDGAQTLQGTVGMANADVRFQGIDVKDRSGHSVSGAGDVNGDGLGDLLIGTRSGDPGGISNAGEVYLVYGRTGAQSLSGAFDLANADVTFEGKATEDRAGFAVSSAGDVNGDGFDDLIIGADYAFGGEDNGIGEAYLIYGAGGAGTLTGTFDLANADATFLGIDIADHAGNSVSSAGDVDGDGLDDLLVAAPYADPLGNIDYGETYLVYGRSGAMALSGTISLSTADAMFAGLYPAVSLARKATSAGDVNGDGLDDILIGDRNGSPGGRSEAGESYLIYGRTIPLPSAGPACIALLSTLGLRRQRRSVR